MTDLARRFSRWLAAPLLCALLVACSGGNDGNEAPARMDEQAVLPVYESRVALPVVIPVATIQRMINEEVPERLVTINRDFDVCVRPARVKIAGARIPFTPPIRCRIVGQIDRGPIRLSADTRDPDAIRLTMPVSATIAARNIAHIIRSETATAEAEVRAVLRLELDESWQPVVRISIDYDWTKKPGIDLLGHRFTFAGRADPELARIIAELERALPAKLRTLGLERQAADMWARGFTSVSINRANPEIWLRLTPRQLSGGGFRIEGDRLVARLALEAGTETFLGPRPPDPEPTPLPKLSRLAPGDHGVRFAAPVVAEFAELEPVLEKELQKLSGEPIDVPLVGTVKVNFGRPTLYTTSGGKLAIGLPMRVKAARQLFSTRGTIWLTGLPVNEPGSRKVRIEQLGIAGETDSLSGDLLLAVASAPRVRDGIEAALSHDFEGDFQKLMVKINTVLAALPIGDFVAVAQADGVNNGVVQPIDRGLFMPVEAYGKAELRYDPARVRAILAQRETDRAARKEARAEAEAAEPVAAAGEGAAAP